MNKYLYIVNVQELMVGQYSPKAMADIYGDLEGFFESIFHNIALSAGFTNPSDRYTAFESTIESDLLDMFEIMNKESFDAEICNNFERVFKYSCRAVYDALDEEFFTDLHHLISEYQRRGEVPHVNVKVEYSRTRYELMVQFMVRDATVDTHF